MIISMRSIKQDLITNTYRSKYLKILLFAIVFLLVVMNLSIIRTKLIMHPERSLSDVIFSTSLHVEDKQIVEKTTNNRAESGVVPPSFNRPPSTPSVNNFIMPVDMNMNQLNNIADQAFREQIQDQQKLPKLPNTFQKNFCNSNFFYPISSTLQLDERQQAHIPSDNTTRYLFGVYPYGPNNQVKSFQETLQVAKLTNRTMVMTTMFRHQQDPSLSKDPYVSTELRMDIDALIKSEKSKTEKFEKFGGKEPGVRFASAEKAFSNCNFQIEKQVYTKAKHDKGRMEYFEKYYQVKLPKFNIPSEMKNLKYLELEDDQDVIEYFEHFDDVNCLAILTPYNNIRKVDYNFENSKFPKYIYDLLEDFSENGIGSDGDSSDNSDPNGYKNEIDLAIHWRYNEGDWGNRCDENLHQRISKKNRRQCKIVKSMGIDDVAEVILNWLRDFEDDTDAETESDTDKINLNIYIASPPSEFIFLDQVKTIILSKISKNITNSFKINILTGQDLQNYFQKNFNEKSCKILKFYKNEVISLVEQAICSVSTDFYYWPLSSWSERVSVLRGLSGDESDNIIDLLEQVLLERDVSLSS